MLRVRAGRLRPLRTHLRQRNPNHATFKSLTTLLALKAIATRFYRGTVTDSPKVTWWHPPIKKNEGQMRDKLGAWRSFASLYKDDS